MDIVLYLLVVIFFFINLISIFREVDRILTEHQIKLNFYIFNIDQAKDLCNFLNITSLPLILYVSSVHKKKYNTLLYKFLNSNKDIKISNAFRYNGDMYCYDYIVEWVEAHYYFTKFMCITNIIYDNHIKHDIIENLYVLSLQLICYIIFVIFLL
ncbi:hypothetical protein PFAG_02806 [Plasmodium falciparum Santa Lucia]|uniref:Thioredoxin domain-containing protein n=2 Tax=Plasmodium falciparum TaxID=5833 RepID=A0A024V5L4_PLAFA|nr:hypothetical protein PFFVO_02819 [Plasmodium falciparum Vietnam Oak-Knoll (FVO)]EUT85773.1 hypothetical protein PFAG_02806 [Plasmodium falciparum Santa Lucia]